MNLKVNEGQWLRLSTDERYNIKSVVSGFFKDAAIIPDAETPEIEVEDKERGNPFCTIACDVAEAAAVAACASLVNPIAIAACVALAHAAGDKCRKQC